MRHPGMRLHSTGLAVPFAMMVQGARPLFASLLKSLSTAPTALALMDSARANVLAAAP